MLWQADGAQAVARDDEGEHVLKVGKRYRCEGCGSEVLVTKATDTVLGCCSAEMQLLEPKKTASAD